MDHFKFRMRIYLVVFLLTLIPALVSFFSVQYILNSAMTFGIDPRIEARLEEAGRNLKLLAKLDSKNEPMYRNQFSLLQNSKFSYSLLSDFTPSIKKSYLNAFLVFLGVGLTFALAIGSWLNRKIIRIHQDTLREMRLSQQQVFYLENRESWRLFAQKLVHEIKNPLTPIQVMVGRLLNKYLKTHSEISKDFQFVLEETREIVNEEIYKVNSWIEAFSKYARMPEPRISQVLLKDLLVEVQKQYGENWENLNIEIHEDQLDGTLIKCDPMLVKQVIFNLVKNSAEASTEKVTVSIRKRKVSENLSDREIRVLLSDNGPGLPKSIQERLFQPGISADETNQMNQTNLANQSVRGFGLAIVKKIMLEHGGDIHWINSNQGCCFELIFKGDV